MLFTKIVPPVIAHRGASAYAPENTFASFLKAKELGARWVEFDVMLTNDNEVVVIHDETLDRTTSGKGFVSESSSSFLRTLDAGSWFDSLFSKEKIPLFSELIDFLYRNQLAANVEIKLPAGDEERKVNTILDVISTHWRKEAPPPLISSFSVVVLEAVRKYSPLSQLGFLMDHWLVDWEKQCDRLECVSVNVNENCLSEERVHKIQSTKRAVLGYTVNDAKRAQKLFSWGVDAVFSDCPDKVLNSLHSKESGHDGKF